jgi:hypothetical protein
MHKECSIISIRECVTLLFTTSTQMSNTSGQAFHFFTQSPEQLRHLFLPHTICSIPAEKKSGFKCLLPPVHLGFRLVITSETHFFEDVLQCSVEFELPRCRSCRWMHKTFPAKLRSALWHCRGDGSLPLWARQEVSSWWLPSRATVLRRTGLHSSVLPRGPGTQGRVAHTYCIYHLLW